MDDPLVSILIPTYNGERFLRPALRSALDQSYRTIEVVVGDDASTDGTPELLASIAATDPRMRVVRHEPNLGGLDNPRALLAEARGEYVKFLMHDDVLATDCVRELVRGMQSDPDVSMAFSHRVLINADGRPVPGHEFKKLADRPGLLDGWELGNQVLLTCSNVIGEPTTVLFRRTDVPPEELWQVDGRSVDVLNDVQLWLYLLARGPAFYTPRTLSRFRSHPGQNTHNPRYVGRGERDWSRMVDWGRRIGFLAGELEERRAQARALLEAAMRLNKLITTPYYGAALEAAFLSTAHLVELTRGSTPADRSGLAERMHSPPALERLTQELDVWTREYPIALAAPAPTEGEVTATVQAFRHVLAEGIAAQAVLAVREDLVPGMVPLVEAALGAGTDIDIQLVPTDQPAHLLGNDQWLAVVPRGSTWHHGRAMAAWVFDPDPAASSASQSSEATAGGAAT